MLMQSYLNVINVLLQRLIDHLVQKKKITVNVKMKDVMGT